MAKVTKKVSRRKKVAKKTKLEVIPEKDFNELNSMMTGVENSKLRMAVEEQNLQNNNLLLENTRLKMIELERKINSQKEHLKVLSERYVKKNKEYTEYKKVLWVKLGYKESAGLGFNPDTREIIEG